MPKRTLILLFSWLMLTGCNADKVKLPLVPDHPEDPLFSDQWHLKNNGLLGGTVGEDINMTPVWQAGNKGEGVVVAVVDDGLDQGHDDLISNLLAGQSYNYADGSTNIIGTGSDSKHGTSVAGIIAAAELNSKGGKGVAPKAKLVGFNLIAGANSTTLNQADAATRNSNVSVSNNSWGPPDGYGTFIDSSLLWKTAITDGVTNGRSNKGIVYVWAAGNGGISQLGIVDNSNYDGYANYYGVMAVAAIGDNGTKANYSEKGANIWISAPSQGTTGKAITTTDLTSTRGYNDGTSSDNYLQQNYTNTFNGTSASTPMVSGVAALILKANPNLTWRDVRIIMAKSARKNHPTDTDWVQNDALDPVGGYHVNHKYGFGAVDASAAVTMAQTWVNVGTLKVETHSFPMAATPLADGDGTIHSITGTVAGSTISKIEYVEIKVDIVDADWGNLVIILDRTTGPDTSSKLSEAHLCIAQSIHCLISDNTWRFGSARHLGEVADGDWTLRISDAFPDGFTGEWTGWSLTFYGE